MFIGRDRELKTLSNLYATDNFVFTRSISIASSSRYAMVPVESCVKVWSMRIPISVPGIISPSIRCAAIIFSVKFAKFATSSSWLYFIQQSVQTSVYMIKLFENAYKIHYLLYKDSAGNKAFCLFSTLFSLCIL